MTVHAHPDDEASKGAGTVARYHAEGVHTVLVCCTGGEEGSILNPAMDRPEVQERLPEIRMEELRKSTEIIGYDEVVLMGYRDSGMPGMPSAEHPRAFVRAPLEETVGRLVAEIRRTRPQVIVTYHEDQSGYPHPDHLRVHDISAAAFEASGDPAAYPDLGSPWEPSKLYYTVWSRAQMVAIHDRFVQLGLESPFGDAWMTGPDKDAEITTHIDIAEYASVRPRALLAHATQFRYPRGTAAPGVLGDPASPLWFGLTSDVTSNLHPIDEYVLGRSRVGMSDDEDDLFAGIRDRVTP
ncbi:MAG TPA: PIG-L family deacetylase [Acidimicrobiales bacterium]|nr:PIG-L family deacetylase [Acidimicrobiales bacterium]